MNYWLIPMDYKTCNYAQMQKEWKENKKIMWQAPGRPEKLKNGNWKVEKPHSMAKLLVKGDIVYFYVTNLPSESKDKISRIMLRGIIKDEPCPIEKNKVYMNSKETDMIYGFSIDSITTLPKEQLENNLFLSYKDLKNKESSFIYPQGKNWPDKRIKKSLSEDLINILEESFKSNMQKNDFEALIKHFNKKCFFCDKCGSKNEHRTFIGRNGLDYFEYHHFIPQYKAKQFPELQNIIDSPTNGLFLCSNCHNKIHYGAVEEVNKMLKLVLDDNQIKEMLISFDFRKNIGEDKDIFEWFQEAYNLN